MYEMGGGAAASQRSRPHRETGLYGYSPPGSSKEQGGIDKQPQQPLLQPRELAHQGFTGLPCPAYEYLHVVEIRNFICFTYE